MNSQRVTIYEIGPDIYKELMAKTVTEPVSVDVMVHSAIAEGHRVEIEPAELPKLEPSE